VSGDLIALPNLLWVELVVAVADWPRLCENSFRSPRRIANGRIRCNESTEIASTWLKLTHENRARAFSHSLGHNQTLEH